MGVVKDVKVGKYEAYFDTKVEWLKEIPSHWKVEKGKWLFNKEQRPVRKEDEIITCFRDGEVTLRRNRKKDGFTIAMKEHGYQGIRKGDLVIHNMDAFAGAIGVSDSDGKSTPVYSACTPRLKNTVNVHYYAYFLQDLAESGYIESLAKGIRERSSDFRFNDFGLLLLSVPPLKEQTAIAEFLDRKTALIDQAIGIKEQQIELLKERRQIVIHRAVTRGLDPKVKLKDSGVELFSKVPVGWEVKRLKYILNERNERSELGEEPLLMMSQIHGLVVRADYHKKAEAAQSSEGNKIVYKNDLVFNKLKAHLGVFYKSTIEFNGIVSPDYAVYYSQGKIPDLKFLEILFRTPEYLKEFICRTTGIVQGLMRLYTHDLFDIPVPVPPVKEQAEILKYINKIDKKITKATSLKQKEIKKLKEYKSTLINSAVTGKIKIS